MNERSTIRVSIAALPAVNIPFDWARVHLPSQPRPMGAPVAPEVAADAIRRATPGRFGKYWLRWRTALVIPGNFVVPRFRHRYLGRAAWKTQQTDTAVAADRRDNLHEPITGLHRTAGSFGDTSRDRAMLAPDWVVRLGAVGLGALACFMSGRVTRNEGQAMEGS